MSEEESITDGKAERLSPIPALIFVSFASLFLEIALIRWLSSEVRIFSHVRNVALIGCFVGLALGYPLSRLRLPLWVSPACALALLLASLPTSLVGEYTLKLLPYRLNNVDVFEVLSLAPLLRWIPGLFQFLLAFVVLLFVFFPIGQRIGELFRELRQQTLRAYSWNVAASLAGVIVFNLVSFAHLAPPAWFLIGFLSLSAAACSKRQLLGTSLLGVLAFVGCCVQQLPQHSVIEQIWSPYQKVEVWSVHAAAGEPWHLVFSKEPPQGQSVPFFMLCSNDIPMMWLLDYSKKTMESNPWLTKPGKIEWYDLAYHFSPAPGRVLVIGAGGGNDVAAALRAGAQHVDAIEIDPVIQQMGRKYNPEHPYSDPRVQVVINDARAFLSQDHEPYDVIVFGQLDNTDWNLMSNLSNIRMDSYIYTIESLKRAHSLLNKDGLMVVNFGASDFWGHRVVRMLKEATGQQPLCYRNELQFHFKGQENAYVVGSPERCQKALASDPQLAAWTAAKGANWDGSQEKYLVTDDWPYWYLAAPKIPPMHLVLSVMFLITIVAIAASVLPTGFSFNGHFWALGAAFTLLETHLISKMALLFGSTWLVNGIVISAVLIMILGANIWVETLGPPRHRLVYPALLLVCLLQFALPPDKFLGWSTLGAVVSLLLYSLPVFFAGLIFARSFAQDERPDHALTANLLGAATGGFLEAISYVTGLNFLMLLVFGLYAASWALVKRT